MSSKVYTSALVIIPPKHLWPQIQQIREKHDRHNNRWMPHITLVYPFFGAELFDTAAEELTESLHDSPPFDITLWEMGSFRHSAKSYSLWLYPSADRSSLGHPSLQNLYSKIHSVFPQFQEQITTDGFIPHLTLAQLPSKEALVQKRGEFLSGWEPIEFRVQEIYFVSRLSDRTPFQVRKVIPLQCSSSYAPLIAPDSDLTSKKGLGVRLLVTNLPAHISEGELESIFRKYTVFSIKIVRKHNMFAFVEVATPREAAEAEFHLTGQMCGGRKLSVRFQPPRGFEKVNAADLPDEQTEDEDGMMSAF